MALGASAHVSNGVTVCRPSGTARFAFAMSTVREKRFDEAGSEGARRRRGVRPAQQAARPRPTTPDPHAIPNGAVQNDDPTKTARSSGTLFGQDRTHQHGGLSRVIVVEDTHLVGLLVDRA